MTRTDIRNVLNHHVEIGNAVVVAGWLRSLRTSKGGFAFLSLNDGSSFDGLQAVAAATLPNYETQIVKLTTGCAVEIEGVVVESQGKDQDREIQATRVTLIGAIDDPETYPIAKKRHTFEYLRTVAHLRPRTNTFGAIARVRNSITQAVHSYFHRNGFVWVNTPIITASDCEGAGQLFRVSTLDALNPPRIGNAVDFAQDFFGQQTYLTVSGQLNVESYCLALSKAGGQIDQLIVVRRRLQHPTYGGRLNAICLEGLFFPRTCSMK